MKGCNIYGIAMAEFSKYSDLRLGEQSLTNIIMKAMDVSEREKDEYTKVPVEVSIVIKPAAGLVVESIDDENEQKEKPQLVAANERSLWF